ncbi:hypothetical protein AKJ09_04952 [Labilithrix luteola]|uniref:Uncharacterized protein n=1 Tax=Labilithrix luteola TaxID=1391654 RepID=A0A0K1PXP2_9BACT|nr:hypothetical protein AKJ09_04952 [Labilithrix luteola]
MSSSDYDAMQRFCWVAAGRTDRDLAPSRATITASFSLRSVDDWPGGAPPPASASRQNLQISALPNASPSKPP